MQHVVPFLADIEHILKTCTGNKTRFEVECCDTGHLYTLHHFLERDLITQSALRIRFGRGTGGKFALQDIRQIAGQRRSSSST